VVLDDVAIASPSDFSEDALDVNEAMDRFAADQAEKAELVKLRFFVGLTTEQAACAMGISVPTAKRWWKFSKAWLRVELHS
jgi:DNA-directed RNA polymerase specialized sigma24 family protein